jgi:hypothetical protein
MLIEDLLGVPEKIRAATSSCWQEVATRVPDGLEMRTPRLSRDGRGASYLTISARELARRALDLVAHATSDTAFEEGERQLAIVDAFMQGIEAGKRLRRTERRYAILGGDTGRRVLRRRIEDALRKTASDDDLLQIAMFLGVRTEE